MKAVLLRLSGLGLLAVVMAGGGTLYAPEPMPAFAAPGKIAGEPVIRVLMASAATAAAVYLDADADLEVRLEGNLRQALVATPGSFGVVPTARGVQVNGRDVVSLRVAPREGRSIRLRWREAGVDKDFELFSPFEFRRVDAGKSASGVLRIVTRLGLETYLAGVLPAEVPPGWPAEALKAQAIAARTFALFHIRVQSGEDYDLRYTMQAWKPAAAKTVSTRDAVNSTAGIVLLERGHFFPAYFASECGGGQTAPVRHFMAFTQPIASLAGVRCPRCAGGEPTTAWRWSITPEDLSAKLSARGFLPAGTRIAAVEAYDDRVSTGPLPGRPLDARMGRASLMIVRDAARKVYRIPAPEFRLAVGGAAKDGLASTWFKLSKTPDGRYVFDGRGWGHGVGLCQVGARYLADPKQGRSYDQILRWYYPEARLSPLYHR